MSKQISLNRKINFILKNISDNDSKVDSITEILNKIKLDGNNIREKITTKDRLFIDDLFNELKLKLDYQNQSEEVVRVYQLSIKLNVSSESVLKLIKGWKTDEDYEIKNHMSIVPKQIHDIIMECFDEEKTKFDDKKYTDLSEKNKNNLIFNSLIINKEKNISYKKGRQLFFGETFKLRQHKYDDSKWDS